MDQDSRPLLIVPAIPHGAGIRFLHSNTQYDVGQHVEVIWAILALCDGINTAPAIASRVHEKFASVDKKTIQGILAELTELGVLVDVRYADQSDVDSAAVVSDLWRGLVGRKKPVRVAKITAAPNPESGATFFAASAVHAPAPKSDSGQSLESRTAGGTGTTAAQALTKAIAEAYERHASGLLRVDVTGKASELTEPWLDPRRIAPLSQDQYARLPTLQPFDADKKWEWVRGFDVVSGTGVLVPIDLVYYPLQVENFGRQLSHHANSSGVAAYTTEGEAIKRGLLELLERDAVMRSWFTRQPPPRIATQKLPEVWRRRHAHWQAKGRETYVLDLSDHSAVTVLVAIVSDSEYPCFSAGAASSITSFDEAVSKAFHEAESGLLDALGQPKTRKIKPQDVAGPFDHAKLYNHPDHLGHIRWLWSGPVTTNVPRASATYDELIQKLLPTAVRLSPSDSPLSVVRVISEKLVPINFGYGTEHFSHPAIWDKPDPDSLKLPHFFA